jgi:hypothetical protein
MYGKRCEPVMPDEGKPCSDERDCQGFCELDNTQRVSPAKIRVLGHCTRTRSTFGCHWFVRETDNGLLPANAHYADRMCVD